MDKCELERQHYEQQRKAASEEWHRQMIDGLRAWAANYYSDEERLIMEGDPAAPKPRGVIKAK